MGDLHCISCAAKAENWPNYISLFPENALAPTSVISFQGLLNYHDVTRVLVVLWHSDVTLRLSSFALEIYNGARYSQVHTKISDEQQSYFFGKQQGKLYSDVADEWYGKDIP